MYFLLYVEVNHGFSRLFVTDTGTTIALDYRSRGPVSWFLGITSHFRLKFQRDLNVSAFVLLGSLNVSQGSCSFSFVTQAGGCPGS